MIRNCLGCLGAALLLLLAGSYSGVWLSAAFAQDAVELTGYAGAESCADCHEDRVADFENTIHGNKGHPRTPASKRGCEACHGPREEHVENGGEGGTAVVFGDSDAASPIAEQNAVCLVCHSKGKLALWQGSEHNRREVGCTSCHSAHGKNPTNFSKPTEVQVCSQCHKGVRAQLQKNSHHPIREGKMTCSDCHNPHGTIADKLIDANQLNEKCYECHAEKRGPFLWQHAPVTENCGTCHEPHGSSHDKLLVSKRPFLCQTCHSNARHPGTLYGKRPGQEGTSVYSGANNRLYYRSCSNCHNQIHGSNHPSGKSLSR